MGGLCGKKNSVQDTKHNVEENKVSLTLSNDKKILKH